MSSTFTGSAKVSFGLRDRSFRRARGPVGAAGVLLLTLSLVGCGAGTAFLPPGLPAVAGGFFAILTLEVVDGIVGRSYVNRLQTNGATPPLSSCNITSGSLPPGLLVRTGASATPADTSDDDTCVIIGTPTTAGSFLFTVEMRDSSFAVQRASQGYTLRIRAETSIATFSVVDAIAGRGYSNSFKVTTNLSNNPDPTEVDSNEAGNGPITACTITSLPANMRGTCVADGTGVAVDVTLTNTGALTASGPTPFTINISDNAITQDGNTVVPLTPVANNSNAAPFALSFTIRPEFSLTSAAPVIPDGTEGGPYNEIFSVTTNLSVSATEVGQATEFGNGPITNCKVLGLPTNLSSSFVLTGGGTGCNVTIDTGTITDPQALYPLIVQVTDSGITQTALVVDTNTLAQNFNFNVTGPPAFTLSTVNAGTTTPCTGGTFTDATTSAPDAVDSRTYGGPARCDLLFTSSGGVTPMVWTINNAPAYLVCTPEGTGDRLLRCNSNGAAASGATDTLDVEVTDNNGTNVTADINGHASHTIAVNAAIALTAATATADAPPPGVQGRTYGNTGAGFTALVYNASAGLGGYVFTQPPSVAAPAPSGVPAAVACTSGATAATCSSGASTVTAAANTYPFTIQVADTQNDTTPSGNTSISRSVTINAALALAPNTEGNAPPPGVVGRTYGDSGSTCAGGAPCVALVYDAVGGLTPNVFTAVPSVSSPSSGVPAAMACGAVGSALTCTTGGSNITAIPGTYPFTVTVNDASNATTPTAAADSVTLAKSVTINPALDFEVLTGTTPANLVVNDPFPPGVVGRPYADLFGASGVSKSAIVFRPVAGTGLGGFNWGFAGSVPADMICSVNLAPNFLGTGDLTCFGDGTAQPTATSFNFTTTLVDTANTSTPAGANSTDNLGDTSHTITINAGLGLAVSVGTATDLPEAVKGRNYADTGLFTCGAAGNVACSALTYTASGGLGSATVNASYIFSTTTGLDAPGVGFPKSIACNTGTNPNANAFSCAVGGGNTVNPITTGNYTPAVLVDDPGNVLTPASTQSGGTFAATSFTASRNLFVNAALAVNLISPSDPPPAGVEGRPYGSGTTCDANGAFPHVDAACSPLTYQATGGLGDSTVNASYVFSVPPTQTDPLAGNGFPDPIGCVVGTNPNADRLVCASAANIAVGAVATETYNPTVTVNDVANATTAASATFAASGSLTRALPIRPPLEFTQFLTPNGITLTASDPFPPGVNGRTYANIFAPDLKQLISWVPTASTGLGVYAWDLATPTAIFTSGTPSTGFGCGTFTAPAGQASIACREGFPGPGITTAVAGTYPYTVTLRDPGNLSTPAGVQQTDNLGHGPGHPNHSVVINAALSLAVSVGTATDLPEAVKSRNYADTGLATCGTAGNVACSALTYTSSGGLGSATVDASYIFSTTTGLDAPGAGFPKFIACNTGTNPNANAFSCAVGGGSTVNPTTTGNFTPGVTVDDVANVLTPSGSASGTTATATRNLFVNDALGLSGGAPNTGVVGRAYGTGGSCSGGACVGYTWTGTGGLGKAAVSGSYNFVENATGKTVAPGPGYPLGLGCAVGVNPNADKFTCSGAIDPTVGNGGYTIGATVTDDGNATTPTGLFADTRTLTVNPGLQFALFTSPTGLVGSFTGSDPFPQGVAGRTYADLNAAAGHDEAIVWLATLGTGLPPYTWDLPAVPLPGAVTCGVFNSGAAIGDEAACFQLTGTLASAGTFPGIVVTLHDTANPSTPTGATSTDNLTHTSHTIVINPALSVASVTPLNSAVNTTAYSNQLTGTGGVGVQAWSTAAGAGFANDPGGDCGTLTLSGVGAITGTPTIVTNNLCQFTAKVDDPGNRTTPDSTSTATSGTAALTIPISGGALSINNNVLINGLASFVYNQTFTATGCTTPGTCNWVNTGAASAPCPVPGGTGITGNSLGAASGLLTSPAGLTTAQTRTFGICVHNGADFALKNFTVTINPADLFVTNSSSNNISVIETSGNTVTATIPAGTTPRAVAVNANGTRAFVTNENSNNISVVDTLTNTVVGTIGLGTKSLGIAVHPNGTRVFATLFAADSVADIDLNINAVAGSVTIDPGGDAQPRGIAVNAAGTRAYVANSNRGTVSVLDLNTSPPTEIDTVAGGGVTPITVGTSPRGVAVDPASNRVYVSNNGSNSVSVISTATNAVTATIDLSPDTAPEGVLVTPDGQHLYVAVAGGKVKAYSIVNNNDDNTPPPPALNALVTTIAAGAGQLRGIDSTVDRLKTYVAGDTNDEVSVIDSNPASGSFNTVPGAAVAVGTDPQNEMGVRAVPYPVLHFTLPVDGGSGRRILAQVDGNNGGPYSDFIRVLGGVAPYTFSEPTAALGLNGTNCQDFNTINTATGAITNSANINPPGGGSATPKNCDFEISVTDSATPPQTISGLFRIVITEE